MFTQANRVTFSATDLINYLGCRHATFLDLADLRQPMVDTEPDPTQELLKKKGLEHERKHLACLRDQGKRVATIDLYSTIDQRIAQTTAAMAEGADVIYQGALLDVPWMGYADFLVRVNGTTRLGSYGYEVVDTKLARTAQPKHVVQLCIYSRLLGLVQEQLPAWVHVVLGDLSQVSLPVFNFLYYAELAQRRLERFVANPPEESIRRALRPLRVLPLERALLDRMGACRPSEFLWQILHVTRSRSWRTPALKPCAGSRDWPTAR